MNENQLREQIAELGKSLYDRGLAHGSAGNISVKLAEGYLLTPTNSCLGRLDPAKISRLDGNGKRVSGDAPSKEAFLHLGMYGERPTSAAVVHLHSLHAVAVSCLDGLNPDDVFPPITRRWPRRCANSQASITRFCWRITARWWRAPLSALLSTPLKNWSKLRA